MDVVTVGMDALASGYHLSSVCTAQTPMLASFRCASVSHACFPIHSFQRVLISDALFPMSAVFRCAASEACWFPMRSFTCAEAVRYAVSDMRGQFLAEELLSLQLLTASLGAGYLYRSFRAVDGLPSRWP